MCGAYRVGPSAIFLQEALLAFIGRVLREVHDAGVEKINGRQWAERKGSRPPEKKGLTNVPRT